jgi:hypothetical protein
VAPRLLPIFRLYYRGGPGYLPQMRYFSQRGLCHDKGEGECRIFGLAVLHWAWRGKSPTSYVYTEGESCSIKKPRPEALLPPPKPGAGFSVRHPSKDVEHSQPRTFAEFFFHALR